MSRNQRVGSLRKITKRYRLERDNFSEVEDIPLAELVGRLK